MSRRHEAQLRAGFFRSYIGKRFRHFKGTVYVVDKIAVHSESAALMVIYHAENQPDQVWCRPAEMFFSPVDKIKYPDVEQYERFMQLKGE